MNEQEFSERAFRNLVNSMSVERFNQALKKAEQTNPGVALKMVAVRMGCI
ncbi:MAG: hypothetical protein PHC68_18755 [Syntrophorhabdaceae bacterium]|nr:hypothetical protein [Syntrophorhabdaceae bacterium]